MKILYIAEKYEYGKPEKGLGGGHYSFFDTLIKMNGGNNEVIYFPFDEMMIKKGREKMNKELLETVFKKRPDLVFFSVREDKIKKEIVKEITQKSKAVTLNWFTDDHWQFDSYSRHWAPYFNWVTTTDPQAVKRYYRIGYKNVIKIQCACNHFLSKPLNLPKIYDVSFVGLAHGNRKKIIREIRKAGINVKCWGGGWQNGRISQEEMLKIFSQSKINLNFTKSAGVFWKELASVFLHRRQDDSIGLNNLKSWPDNVKTMRASLYKKQIKARNFEIPGCGGFLLSEYVDYLEDYYKIDKEIVCFNTIPELIEKIKYYLRHDKEREAITKAGYERTIRDHTYEKRFNKIFKIIGLLK